MRLPRNAHRGPLKALCLHSEQRRGCMHARGPPMHAGPPLTIASSNNRWTTSCAARVVATHAGRAGGRAGWRVGFVGCALFCQRGAASPNPTTSCVRGCVRKVVPRLSPCRFAFTPPTPLCHAFAFPLTLHGYRPPPSHSTAPTAMCARVSALRALAVRLACAFFCSSTVLLGGGVGARR